MLRLQGDNGWWLVTHPDHAYLAGEFASQWGNELFAPPEPRTHVLRGIYAHDDGWSVRDAKPSITRQRKPAAFSVELVGAYSAFEEIDLEAYLAVRRSAVQLMAQQDAYAAILISMHTYNLLTARADRSTIRPEKLPLLDEFLAQQKELQRELQEQLAEQDELPLEQITLDALTQNFRLLQACDNLSLLSCVDFTGEATLLWPQKTLAGGACEVVVTRMAERSFRLAPYPFADPRLTFKLRARFVRGLEFGSNEALQACFDTAEVEELKVAVSA
jgi:hypothetical protein